MNDEKNKKKASQKGRPAPDKRPARQRYWESGGLAMRKIRRLVRSGYKPMVALALWQSTRKRKQGAIPSLVKIQKLGG